MLKIYNDLTRRKETFKPIHEGAVGLYVCGPTVYGPPHLGHGRSYVNFDVVRRYLDFTCNKTIYVQNITDVGHLVGDGDEGEDKILRQAQKENTNPYAIAYKYECDYFDKMDALNIKRPTISCRATGFIPEMIDFVETLIEKGFAYVTDKGNVYFSIEKFPEYGKLSGRKLENALSGERIEIAGDKRRPEDFALWKSAEGGHIMKWKSPWGEGYPGWHVECSVLSKKFLGDTFDIHGGGMDNIFPHHESEIAQSECANGKPFVNYFMHNNLITVNGQKMGKSLGNSATLEGLMEKFDPMWIRYFILLFHYRSPIDFSEKAIAEAGAQFEKIKTAYHQIYEKTKGETGEISPGDVKNIYDAFIAAMDEDFNTPLAISELLKAVKLANKLIAENAFAELKELLKLFNDLAINVLGLDFKAQTKNEENEIPSEVISIANERRTARINKDFALSDELRDKISALGYTVKDKPNNEFELEKK